MLKPLQTNKDIGSLSGDKDSSVVILDISCYKEKTNRLIPDGISKGVYVIEENDNIDRIKTVSKFNLLEF